MGSVGEVVEVGTGSGAWTEFEVCTKRDATGPLSWGGWEREDIPASAGRSAAARATAERWAGGLGDGADTHLVLSEQRATWIMPSWMGKRVKMDWAAPTEHPPRGGCYFRTGIVSP